MDPGLTVLKGWWGVRDACSKANISSADWLVHALSIEQGTCTGSVFDEGLSTGIVSFIPPGRSRESISVLIRGL